MSEPINIDPILEWPVFGLSQEEKSQWLLVALKNLTNWHDKRCPEYHSVLSKIKNAENMDSISDLPFLPVRLFKSQKLLSIPYSDVIKIMTSSGTSGQNVSQIFLDKKTSSMQVKILSKIVSSFIGPQRLPMLVIDCRATIVNRFKFSARTAGILGFSIFGHDVEFALDDDMTINLDRVSRFLEKYTDQDILLFGFTFIVWQHWIRYLEDVSIKVPIRNGILMHGGGWKQLQSQAVSPNEFKYRLKSVSEISRIHNYYGMVEQTGSIFIECEEGNLHTSSWSEIIIRNPTDFKVMPKGGVGLIQLLSVIPHSYPGHSLLSEDEGEIIGVDGCSCGRLGTYFRVYGRIQNAEVRGCSDTYSR
ncbi:LuxE/PaaK family acyltransferase [Polynucleobacter sp. HIN7]|uniref:LuxE/PaaK family acyltransferase n=1 Tax=Polynucleobacter sp. HIN7 TaxID=3047866 RepID=UPI0025725C25|nr:acyl-protein synthetase [Polynucleobacter sp. HIN7]BEI36592.1 acyl-protein synthetase [Polynucleobacter sp. HIN7]